jgi:hypothetical protein
VETKSNFGMVIDLLPDFLGVQQTNQGRASRRSILIGRGRVRRAYVSLGIANERSGVGIGQAARNC